MNSFHRAYLIFIAIFLQNIPLYLCFIPSRTLNHNNNVKKYSITSSTQRHNTQLSVTSPKSDTDGNYDPDASELTETEIAAAANEFIGVSGKIDLPQEISNSFLQYALSIILGRALPDARDGLKPVHRRILYAMYQLNLSYKGSHRKCARVVGEVLGKFHPHGDTAVYDALVRLAQPFSSGTPLIDGHGNFGSIDADPAAAMRYTECKLTRVSSETLLEDIMSDTVDFISNFDGNEMEPTVLPARIPLLLVNGCAGIAVGMATNVPPHNLGEIMDACVALGEARVAGEKVTDDRLFKLVPGPDFPTGASILGVEDSKKMHKSGHGGVTIRAITHMEKIGKSGKRTAIVITQLPYQVNKANLLEKIASLVNDKKMEGISDLRDESDRDGIRVVIECKKDAVPMVVLNNLYKQTQLQTQFSGNFLALMGSDGTKPERFTLRSALEYFLEFRFDTIRRKAQFDLGRVSSRNEIVMGLLKALEDVDRVIEIIRNAENTADAKETLVQDLELTETQADAVLKLQLGQLTRLNKDKLLEEKATLEKSIEKLEILLRDDNTVWNTMVDDFKDIKSKFSVPRRTKIEHDSASSSLSDLDLITNSRSVIVVTNGGYIKRLPLQTFSNQRRGTRGKKAASTSDISKEDNTVSHCFSCNDHDTLLITTQRGVAYGLRAFEIPPGSRTARGVPIPSVLPFKPNDVISSILPVSEFNSDEFCILCTENGWIKKTPLDAFENLTSRGLIIASLEKGDRLRWCEKCTDQNDVLIASKQGLATRFEASKLRPTGRNSRGVKSMNLKESDCITDMSILEKESTTPTKKKKDEDEDQYILVVTKNGYGKRVLTSEFRATNRGGKGVIATKFKAASSEDIVSCLRVVNQNDEVLMTTTNGIIVRQKVGDIPCQGRAATGVTVQKIDTEKGDEISFVSIVPAKIVDEED